MNEIVIYNFMQYEKYMLINRRVIARISTKVVVKDFTNIPRAMTSWNEL